MAKRLDHPLWRCNVCGTLLTELEIVEKWEAAEAKVVEDASLCKCGSGRIRPTNLTEEEEEKFLNDDQLSRLLAGVDDRYTKVWKQALWSIKTGEAVECSDDERQIAESYFGVD